MMKGMFVLKIYIDTSQRYEKKVILRDDKDSVVDEVSGDIDVVSEVDKLLKKHKISPKDIQTYEVNKGPGSFTGLKIGVTVANIFNWALGRAQLKDLVYPEYGKEPNITPRPKI
jgi:tRNA A37 threonylcarbamoyladenosine modification protein TsaB